MDRNLSWLGVGGWVQTAPSMLCAVLGPVASEPAVLPQVVTALGLFVIIFREIVFMKMIQCCLFCVVM